MGDVVAERTEQVIILRFGHGVDLEHIERERPARQRPVAGAPIVPGEAERVDVGVERRGAPGDEERSAEIAPLLQPLRLVGVMQVQVRPEPVEVAGAVRPSGALELEDRVVGEKAPELAQGPRFAVFRLDLAEQEVVGAERLGGELDFAADFEARWGALVEERLKDDVPGRASGPHWGRL